MAKDTFEDVKDIPLGMEVFFDDPESPEHKATGFVVAVDEKDKTITLNRAGVERVVKFSKTVAVASIAPSWPVEVDKP